MRRNQLPPSDLLHTGSLLVNVITVGCTDTAHLTMELPEDESGLITGRIEHLKNPEFVSSIELDGFTIRYLDAANKSIIELISCQPHDVGQDGILQFYSNLDNLYITPVIIENFDRTKIMFTQIQQSISSREHKHIVFVLGAGASIEVLPGGADLLRKMLREKPEGEAQRFIADVFKTNLEESLPFPSFNQVLSVIDIALEREEVFSARYSLDKLRIIKKQLIMELRQYMIDQSDEIEENSYFELISRLKRFYEMGGQISFINLNYDLLLDNALQKVFGNNGVRYVLPFRSWNSGKADDQVAQEERIEDNRIDVVKLHGSLDWMICPTCFEAYRFSGIDLQKSLSERICKIDHTALQEFLFPPTKERIEVHSHWIRLQQEADRLLRNADKVVFIGFSLSEDDAHFRFKLKKNLYRPENPVYVQVIDRPKSSYDVASDHLARHYWQFFGPIDYRPSGFGYFARNPH